MFFKRALKPFLSQPEIELVLDAIRDNEKETSGEIRLWIESKCIYVNPLDRARELFHQLKMFNTTHRNAILIYIAHEDHDFALFGDYAIHKKVKQEFWNQEAKRLCYHFFHHQEAEGIQKCIDKVGEQMHLHFPFEGLKKNELPDEIVFGK
jgi:uncharacterized membrane protein